MEAYMTIFEITWFWLTIYIFIPWFELLLFLCSPNTPLYRGNGLSITSTDYRGPEIFYTDTLLTFTLSFIHIWSRRYNHNLHFGRHELQLRNLEGRALLQNTAERFIGEGQTGGNNFILLVKLWPIRDSFLIPGSANCLKKHVMKEKCLIVVCAADWILRHQVFTSVRHNFRATRRKKR